MCNIDLFVDDFKERLEKYQNISISREILWGYIEKSLVKSNMRIASFSVEKFYGKKERGKSKSNQVQIPR